MKNDILRRHMQPYEAEQRLSQHNDTLRWHMQSYEESLNQKVDLSDKIKNETSATSPEEKKSGLASRIEYSGNGVFSVNINSLNRATRNNYRIASQNPNNWTYNSQTGYRDIGISRKVGEIQIHNSPISDRSDYIPLGVDQKDMTVRTEGEIARSTGRPDRRVGRNINTVGSGIRTRGGAGIMLVIDAFVVGYDLWNAFSTLQDYNAIDKDMQSLQNALILVKVGINRGLVPSQYQNKNDLGAITNFVFQGINNTGNQDITLIGTNILKLSKNYADTQAVIPVREWKDH